MKEVIISPVATEKTMLDMEKLNTLTFIVDMKANKNQIKREVESRFEVKVLGVRVLITPSGKKAIVKLSPEFSADEISGRIGVF